MLVSLTWGSSLVAMPYAVGALGYIGALLAICVLHACSTYASLLVMQARPPPRPRAGGGVAIPLPNTIGPRPRKRRTPLELLA